MSRPTSPRTARPAAGRWLMVVLALAGLGILHGSHCAESTQTAVLALPIGVAAVEESVPAAIAADVAVLWTAPAPAHHNDGRTPGALAGACLFLLAAVVGTALVLTDALRRTSPGIQDRDAPSALRIHGPVLPLCLANLGVLRI